MKKILVAIMAVLCSAPSFAQYSSGGFSLSESTVYYGIRLGMNISSITGDYLETVAQETGSKAGLTLGGVIGMRVSDSTPIFLESGAYFSGRGAKKLTMNYLEIPVLIKYGIQVSDDIALLPHIGPYFSMGLSGKQKTATEDAEGNPVVKKTGSYDKMRRPDMGIKIGCGAEYSKLYAELGYQFGITNIAKDNPQDLSAGTSNIYFNIGVNF